jgi:hypothetical protein
MLTPTQRVGGILLVVNVLLVWWSLQRLSRCNSSLDQCVFVTTTRRHCGPESAIAARELPAESASSLFIAQKQPQLVIPTSPPPTRPRSSASLLKVPRISIRDMNRGERIALPLQQQPIPITLFSAPRVFDDDTSARQRSSILSWMLLPGPKEVQAVCITFDYDVLKSTDKGTPVRR